MSIHFFFSAFLSSSCIPSSFLLLVFPSSLIWSRNHWWPLGMVLALDSAEDPAYDSLLHRIIWCMWLWYCLKLLQHYSIVYITQMMSDVSVFADVIYRTLTQVHLTVCVCTFHSCCMSALKVGVTGAGQSPSVLIMWGQCSDASTGRAKLLHSLLKSSSSAECRSR